MKDSNSHALPSLPRASKHGHGNHHRHHSRHHTHSHRHSHEPAFHIICLGSGGGPSESNVTGFLVRSIGKRWSKDSVLAVDAGCHLSSIIKILEPQFPLVSEAHPHQHHHPNQNHAHPGGASPTLTEDQSSDSSVSSVCSTPEAETTVCSQGPFAGLPFPYESARANALHVVRECVSTYLITHPHLDHLSGFVINTAAFHNSTRPKKLAALSSTVNAIKTHIFNDIIWPNLTDEDGGVGFVTFQRLAQGGNIAVGEGSGKGYIEVCDGLCVKGLKVSHGHCSQNGDQALHWGSDFGLSDAALYKATAVAQTAETPVKTGRTPSLPQILPRQLSWNSFQPGTPVSGTGAVQTPQQGTAAAVVAAAAQPPPPNGFTGESGRRDLVVDSTAYFIRDDATRREILFFGDVEPDAVSLYPRNLQIWTEAAPKIVHRSLRAIVIECSYDDSQADNILFGHLAPRHLFHELQVLAELVKNKRADNRSKKEGRKRKMTQAAAGFPFDAETTDASGPPTEDEAHLRQHKKKSVKYSHSSQPGPTSGPGGESNTAWADSPSPTSGTTIAPTPVAQGPKRGPLAGVTVVVIHVKDTLRDGPVVGERILHQLQQHEEHVKEADGLGLGCEFVISEAGGSYWV